jgi:hypothetical protein
MMEKSKHPKSSEKGRQSLSSRKGDKDRRNSLGDRSGMSSDLSDKKKSTVDRIIKVLDKGGRKREPNGKRKHKRKPFYNIVDYATRDGFHKDFLKDLSVGGVFIETNFPFSVGQDISMIFTPLKAQKKIKIVGKIIRLGEDGIGVKFSMTDEKQERMLISFLDTL